MMFIIPRQVITVQVGKPCVLSTWVWSTWDDHLQIVGSAALSQACHGPQPFYQALFLSLCSEKVTVVLERWLVCRPHAGAFGSTVPRTELC